MAEWIRCSECGTRRARRHSGACKQCEPIVFARQGEESRREMKRRYGPLASHPAGVPFDAPWTADELAWHKKISRNTIPTARWLATVEQLEARIGALETALEPFADFADYIDRREHPVADDAPLCRWGLTSELEYREIPVAAVRRARAALRQPPAATGGEGA